MAEHSIKDTLETVAGYIGEEVKDALDEKQDICRTDTMPTASEDLVGTSYQYIGTTNPNFTHNYFYECIALETDPVSYAWEAVKVQSTNAGGRPIMLRMDDGWRPYISLTFPDDIPAFEDLTPGDLVEFANMYYNNEISLADIQNKWDYGDTMTLPISAMEATGVAETHDAQNVSVRILDFNHDTLDEAIGTHETSFMTLGFLLAENGVYSSTDGWHDSVRRTWCNSVVFNALPSVLKDCIKSVARQNGQGTTTPGSQQSSSAGDRYDTLIESVDKIYIPHVVEITGSNYTPQYGWCDATDTTQYGYFANAETINLTKDVMTCTNVKYYNGGNYNYYRNGLKCATSAGADVLSNVGAPLGIYLVINV